MAFTDDVVAFVKDDSQVTDLVQQLAKIEHSTGLGININQMKVMYMEKVPKIQEKIPDALINRFLWKFHCERCDRFVQTARSLNCHRAPRYYNGTKNCPRAKPPSVSHVESI
eukprot:snap_masked-scaffold_45-processed-gene-1.52-mRNA-1 protein AED:1.00 eAED:1.00 QI:0/-1/0/0/-1/1/1/0/111